MASVLEMEEALLADQRSAQEAFDLSVASISTIGSVAAWTMTGLAVVIAIECQPARQFRHRIRA